MTRRPTAARVPTAALCNLERIMTLNTPSARMNAVFETALAARIGLRTNKTALRIVDAIKSCGGPLRETIKFLLRAG